MQPRKKKIATVASVSTSSVVWGLVGFDELWWLDLDFAIWQRCPQFGHSRSGNTAFSHFQQSQLLKAVKMPKRIIVDVECFVSFVSQFQGHELFDSSNTVKTFY